MRLFIRPTSRLASATSPSPIWQKDNSKIRQNWLNLFMIYFSLSFRSAPSPCQRIAISLARPRYPAFLVLSRLSNVHFFVVAVVVCLFLFIFVMRWSLMCSLWGFCRRRRRRRRVFFASLFSKHKHTHSESSGKIKSMDDLDFYFMP